MMNGKLWDSADFDVEYKTMAMWDQLGKIQDSESAREVVKPSKFKAVNTVTTDDGIRIAITPNECQRIKDVLLQVRTPARAKILKQLQMSKGLTNMLKLIR